MKINFLSLYIFLLFFVNIVNGQEPDTSFHLSSEQFYNSRQEMNSDFHSSKQQIIADYQKFVMAKRKAFKVFAKSIEKKWGENNLVVSNRFEWVEYSDDKDKRSRVDFKDGKASVEVLVSAEEAKDKELARKKIIKAVKELLKNKGKTLDFPVEDVTPEPLTKEPVLIGLIETKEGELLNNENADKIAKKIVDENLVETKTVESDEGTKTELIINFPLSKNYLLTRFNQVKPFVKQFAEKYDVEPALIVAVIHVESYFNPKAVSPANAVGLMQLVPSSGGLEAYAYVYGKKKKPTYNELINPNINTELGTAYLHILMTRYFDNINNDDNKRYCTIASYNTGVGNVSLTLTGTKSYTKACKKANEYKQPIVLYNYLTKNLKYEEARKYLKKVNDRYLEYKEMVYSAE